MSMGAEKRWGGAVRAGHEEWGQLLLPPPSPTPQRWHSKAERTQLVSLLHGSSTQSFFFFLGIIINVNLQVRKLKHKEVSSYSWEMAALGFQSKMITKALLNITICGLPFSLLSAYYVPHVKDRSLFLPGVPLLTTQLSLWPLPPLVPLQAQSTVLNPMVSPPSCSHMIKPSSNHFTFSNLFVSCWSSLV